MLLSWRKLARCAPLQVRGSSWHWKGFIPVSGFLVSVSTRQALSVHQHNSGGVLVSSCSARRVLMYSAMHRIKLCIKMARVAQIAPQDRAPSGGASTTAGHYRGLWVKMDSVVSVAYTSCLALLKHNIDAW